MRWKLFYMSADQLLDLVPEGLRDVPLDALEGETPRQAAKHYASSSCQACRYVLIDLAEKGAA